jgi:hypothetical protein
MPRKRKPCAHGERFIVVRTEVTHRLVCRMCKAEHSAEYRRKKKLCAQPLAH